MDLDRGRLVPDFADHALDEASAKNPKRSKTDVARYVLRFDVVFPGGTSWMNEQVFLGTHNDQLNTPSGPNGGKRTMSLALDLIQGMEEDGPVVLRISDNFGATEQPFVGPLTVYIDNIRLVDTYASGAKPVTTLLQSFEDPGNPVGGVADFTGWGELPGRLTVNTPKRQPMTSVSPKAAMLSRSTFPARGIGRLTLPSPSRTKLAEILKLDQLVDERLLPAELERRTLRFLTSSIRTGTKRANPLKP
ncbi:MAG: hypothetical protein U1G07_02335 [Verrucomicrobiota bacterium]